jgi:hypothetical protein
LAFVSEQALVAAIARTRRGLPGRYPAEPGQMAMANCE